ncbi:MAG TPA: PAS domain S-box protein, partial [bacterium]|nr:PAS domain S-box protein [bacterium]
RRKDGTRFPVVVYASPIILDGVGVGMRAIVIDITERKTAEAERERLIRAIEHVNESVVITDTQGNIEYKQRLYALYRLSARGGHRTESARPEKREA